MFRGRAVFGRRPDVALSTSPQLRTRSRRSLIDDYLRSARHPTGLRGRGDRGESHRATDPDQQAGRATAQRWSHGYGRRRVAVDRCASDAIPLMLGPPTEAQQRAWSVEAVACHATGGPARPITPSLAIQPGTRNVAGAGYRVSHGVERVASDECPSLDTTRHLEPGVMIAIEPGVSTPLSKNLEHDVLISESGCELLIGSQRRLERKP